MKKHILNSTIVAAFLATSSMAFAQPVESTSQPQMQNIQNKDRKSMMEEWKKMPLEERQAKIIEKSNERIDKDLADGIITKEDAKTLRAANKIIAMKILPAKEKEMKEKSAQQQKQ